MKFPEKNIIVDFNSGNKQAFEKFFNMFYKALCLFAGKYVYDDALAEDIVQEVFITLWKKWSNFKNLTSVKTFLYEAVRNKSLNYIKHIDVRKRFRESQIREMESEHYFVNHLLEEETHRILYEEINKLPTQCCKILLLSLEGLKNQEIAEDLSVSINTVKTQKKIAYKHLRLNLKNILSFIIIFTF